MSRRKTFPSLSSSRQMMTAWNDSGLSQRPAIIASRPASMRLAMAISPSRDKSSTEPISRRYMRTGSSVRSEGSLVSDLASGFGVASTSSPDSALPLRALRRLLAVGLGFLGLDDVDAHLVHHRQHVFDLLGGDLLGRHDGVELLIGDIAALLGLLDHLLDGGVGEIEQRQRGIGRFRAVLLRRLGVLRLGGLRRPRRNLAGGGFGGGALRCHLRLQTPVLPAGTLHVPYPMVLLLRSRVSQPDFRHPRDRAGPDAGARSGAGAPLLPADRLSAPKSRPNAQKATGSRRTARIGTQLSGTPLSSD